MIPSLIKEFLEEEFPLKAKNIDSSINHGYITRHLEYLEDEGVIEAEERNSGNLYRPAEGIDIEDRGLEAYKDAVIEFKDEVDEYLENRYFVTGVQVNRIYEDIENLLRLDHSERLRHIKDKEYTDQTLSLLDGLEAIERPELTAETNMENEELKLIGYRIRNHIEELTETDEFF